MFANPEAKQSSSQELQSGWKEFPLVLKEEGTCLYNTRSSSCTPFDAPMLPNDANELPPHNEEAGENEACDDHATSAPSATEKPSAPPSASDPSTSTSTSTSPQHLREEHWKASPWAVGCVDPTWHDTVQSGKRRRRERRTSGRDTRSSRQAEFETYLCVGAWFCNMLGAKRVGNMAVLVGDIDGDENVNLKCVAGPYWPVNACITWPAVIGLTVAVVVLGLSDEHPGIIAACAVLTACLMISMVCVSFRDPGILRRRAEKPDGAEGQQWIWNDQSLTYRPLKARYDSECACVIEEHDHVCPWVGSAIGRGNMCAFRCFVALIFAVMIFDIIIIVARAVPR